MLQDLSRQIQTPNNAKSEEDASFTGATSRCLLNRWALWLGRACRSSRRTPPSVARSFVFDAVQGVWESLVLGEVRWGPFPPEPFTFNLRHPKATLPALWSWQKGWCSPKFEDFLCNQFALRMAIAVSLEQPQYRTLSERVLHHSRYSKSTSVLQNPRPEHTSLPGFLS